MNLYKSYFILHLSVYSLILLGGCVPTLGSHFTGKEELAKGEYINLNTVPLREEAEKGLSSEEASRNDDRIHLEEDLLKNQEEEKALREKAFPSPLSSDRKE